MRGLRTVLTFLDIAVWLGVGYLIYQSAGLVFGRLIGQGVLHVVGVAVLSVVGTALSIRALGRDLAKPGNKDSGAMFSAWMSRLFIAVMLISFLVWDGYAIRVGLGMVFPTMALTARWACLFLFFAYSIALVINYRNVFWTCTRDAR